MARQLFLPALEVPGNRCEATSWPGTAAPGGPAWSPLSTETRECSSASAHQACPCPLGARCMGLRQTRCPDPVPMGTSMRRMRPKNTELQPEPGRQPTSDLETRSSQSSWVFRNHCGDLGELPAGPAPGCVHAKGRAAGFWGPQLSGDGCAYGLWGEKACGEQEHLATPGLCPQARGWRGAMHTLPSGRLGGDAGDPSHACSRGSSGLVRLNKSPGETHGH